MAYGLKYSASYKTISNNTRHIYIYEKDYSDSVTTFDTGEDPLQINIDGNVNDLYCGTVGSGATINLRVTPLQLISLFTTDPQKYLVKCVDQNNNINWQGFINSNVYFENLDSNKTLISLNANDGMAVLDMTPYRPTSTTYYEGVVPIATVLNNILSKLNLVFNERWGLIDLRVADYQDNVFLYLETNQNNYIDENGKPMTCRQVLNTIMTSFGLRMSFRGDKIYIIDPIILHNVNKGQLFNSGWGETIQSFPGGYLDISLNQIRWFQKGITSDIISPINQLEIKYDPYTFTDVNLDLSDTLNWSDAGTFSGPYGNVPNRYYINSTIQFKNVVCDGSILQQAIRREDETGSEYYFKLQKNSGSSGNPGFARISFPLTSLYKDTNLKLKMSADFYCNTRDYNNIYDTSISSENVEYVDVSIGYQLGSGPDSSIHWLDFRIKSNYTSNETSKIEDDWYTNSFSFPYGELGTIYNDGSLNVYLWGKYNTAYYGTGKNVLIKNLKVEVVNSNGDIITNEGIKYTALEPVIDDYIIEPTNIDLLHGTGPYGTSKGAYRDYNTKLPSTGIYRGLDAGTGTLYPNSYHVAQSFISQYKNPRRVLKGDLNVATHRLDTQNYLIKWSKYYPDKAFLIVSGTYYDKNEYMSVEMVEIESTRENIT